MAFRVLIVANGFVQGAPDSFPPDVRKLFEQPHEVRVLVPTRTGRLAWLTSDTGPATREASTLVSEILADMQRKGIEHPRAATWATKTSSWRSKTPSPSSAPTPSSSWGTCRGRTIGTSDA
jgi:hypothetical protein